MLGSGSPQRSSDPDRQRTRISGVPRYGVAILEKKAALERALRADEVAYLIAGRVNSNIRQLEGSLTRMIAEPLPALCNPQIHVGIEASLQLSRMQSC